MVILNDSRSHATARSMVTDVVYRPPRGQFVIGSENSEERRTWVIGGGEVRRPVGVGRHSVSPDVYRSDRTPGRTLRVAVFVLPVGNGGTGRRGRVNG